jgi:hypothetical protein
MAQQKTNTENKLFNLIPYVGFVLFTISSFGISWALVHLLDWRYSFLLETPLSANASLLVFTFLLAQILAIPFGFLTLAWEQVQRFENKGNAII